MKCLHPCFVIIFCLFLVGCKKEDPNPELLDPVYQDLLKRSTDFQKSYDDELVKQKGIRESMPKLEANSIELKNAQRDLAKSLHASVDFDQKAHYFKIRAQRRLLVDRITYKEAFSKNLTWPDPREYSDYQTNIRLHEVNPNWNAHVPKLQSRLEKTPAKEEKAKEKAE